jgi:hypothetical protein
MKLSCKHTFFFNTFHSVFVGHISYIFPTMDVPTIAHYVTHSKTHQSFLPTKSNTTITDAADAPITKKLEHGPTKSCLVTPSEIRKHEHPLDTSVVVRRPSTASLLTTHQKEKRDWHTKRKKKLTDRRRTFVNKLGFSTNSANRYEGITDCNLKATFLLTTSTNKQVTDDFHSLKICRLETEESWFSYVVPGGVMQDLLLNFKTEDFYQKVRSNASNSWQFWYILLSVSLDGNKEEVQQYKYI